MQYEEICTVPIAIYVDDPARAITLCLSAAVFHLPPTQEHAPRGAQSRAAMYRAARAKAAWKRRHAPAAPS